MTGAVRLSTFLHAAYPTRPWKYSAPIWVETEYYEIGGLASTGTTEETAVAMLRTALAERLGLKCHFEERQTSVYVLTVPEGGHKLTAAAPIVPEGRDRHMGILKNDSATLTDITYFLTTQMDRDVIRRMLPDPGVVIKAIRALGLNLESRKVPLKVLVVDKVNREPSAN